MHHRRKAVLLAAAFSVLLMAVSSKAAEKDLHTTVCVGIVRDAAEILEELLR